MGILAIGEAEFVLIDIVCTSRNSDTCTTAKHHNALYQVLARRISRAVIEAYVVKLVVPYPHLQCMPINGMVMGL